MKLEFKTAQEPILKYLQQIGWTYIKPEECNELRGGITGLFMLPTLKNKLKELNKRIIETDEQADEIIKKLIALRNNIQGNKEILSYLRGEKTKYVEKEKRELNIKFIDFNNPENNEYHVTKELYFKDIKTDRADIVLFINGFPIIIIETKPPTAEEGIDEAFAQIKRYHNEIPEFIKVLQVYSLSDGLELRYGSTWNLRSKDRYRWKIKSEKVNLEKLTKTFFDKKTILQIIEDYIVFYIENDELKKLILTQHQIRAVNKIIKRALEKDKDSGLIWHTQGSGKTVTMIIAANKLRKLKELENPTILLVVDRKELETQMKNKLISYGFSARKSKK
jgi:type I restriction enzyme R subunit